MSPQRSHKHCNRAKHAFIAVFSLTRREGVGRQRGSGGADADAAAGAQPVAQDALPTALAVLVATVGGGARLLADPLASAFYFTLMKTLRQLVPEVSACPPTSSLHCKSLAPSVASVLHLLRLLARTGTTQDLGRCGRRVEESDTPWDLWIPRNNL